MKISFAFPVLNESGRLDRCLTSIRSQTYPQNKIEIIIADGGSSDNSIEIAKKYGAIVLNNEVGLAEPGAALAHSKASGDIKVFYAADNVLPTTEWVSELVEIFNFNSKICGVYTHIATDPCDNSLNKYYSELHVEPFTYAIYGHAANPRFFCKIFEVAQSNNLYSIFKFSPQNHPLLALAQGFAVRSSYIRPPDTIFDDIEPIIRMIEDDQLIAYAPNLGIYHFHLKGILGYLRKYSTRIDNTLYNQNFGINSRTSRLTFTRIINKYLFVFSGILIFPKILEGFYLIINRKKLYMAHHIPASIFLAYLIFFRYVKFKISTIK